MLRMAALGLAIVAIAIVVAAPSGSRPRESADQLLPASIEDPAARRRLIAAADEAGGTLVGWARSVVARLPARIRPESRRRVPGEALLRSAAMRSVLLLQLLPVMLLPAGAGLALGLARREAASRGAAWSSNTLVRLGMNLVLFAILGCLLFAFSSLPLALCYVPFGLIALGAYLVFGNVPCRI